MTGCQTSSLIHSTFNKYLLSSMWRVFCHAFGAYVILGGGGGCTNCRNKQVLEGGVQDGSNSTFAVLNKMLMLDY